MRDAKTRKRLHDELEQTTRYRAAFRALTGVTIMQALLYTWSMLQSVGLPAIPPGLAAVATLLVAHLAFWVPYLLSTKQA